MGKSLVSCFFETQCRRVSNGFYSIVASLSSSSGSSGSSMCGVVGGVVGGRVACHPCSATALLPIKHDAAEREIVESVASVASARESLIGSIGQTSSRCCRRHCCEQWLEIK